MEEEAENRETISLGGNIGLNGFQNVDRGKLVVLKKVIGNYVKQMQEKKSDYEKFALTLEGDEENATVKAELTAGGNSTVGEGEKGNIFVAVDSALKKIIEQI